MPASHLRRLILTSAAIVLSCPSHAQTTIHIPADQPTIQAGINAAANGDTVLVSPGTYFENIDFKGKAITITSSGGASVTTIDGGGTAPAAIFQTLETRAATLSGFTIIHGGSLTAGADLSKVNGGIVIRHSRPSILNNIITQSYCQNIQTSYAGPLIQNNVISSSLNPEKCVVSQTGGIYLGGDYSDILTFPQSNITPTVIIGNTIENNTTGQLGDGGGDGGAGIATWSSTPIIVGNIFRNNITRNGSGGAINLVYFGDALIANNIFIANQAGCGGGAIGLHPGPAGEATNPYSLAVIANNTMVNNTNYLDGGGYSNCLLSSTLFDGASGTRVVNNIIVGDTTTPLFQCQKQPFNIPDTEWYQPIFDHNLFFNKSGPALGANCTDTTTLHGNIVADPQFRNAASSDFHLSASSPAIDTGNNSVLAIIQNRYGYNLQTDFDGNPREQDATAQGHPIIDIGAYEVTGATGGSTRIVLKPSAYSGSAGARFTLTATLQNALGAPTGTAYFFVDGTALGSAPIQSGSAILSNVTLSPGTHISTPPIPARVSSHQPFPS